jgi:adenosylmethionine-8-amino-7-oxononanoate aminotransferase
VLVRLTPGDLNRFFCSGGSSRSERLKIAKQVRAMRGLPNRYKIIARRGGYHGATLRAMSVYLVARQNALRPLHVWCRLRPLAQPIPQ